MSPAVLVKDEASTQSAEPTAVEAGRGLYVARAELVLARADHRPLGKPVLNPDPLEQLAAAFAEVRTESGEEADLAIDLLPVPGAKVARRRRRLVARATRRGPSAFGEQLEGSGRQGGGWAAVWGVLNGTAVQSSSQGRPRVPRQSDLTEGVGKFTPDAEVFALQVLVRCTARHPARARARLHQVMAALQALRGENRFVPAGPRVGMWRPYSNAWWLRRGFDRKFVRGDFAPARRSWVTWQEVAGLLKPPTVHCTAQNVVRTGGVVAPAPAGLPTWTGQADVLPLGMVTGADGVRRMAGAYADEVLFGASFGKSGYGKTEQALVQFAARAYAGDGGWFLDPHRAAWQRIKPYLAHPALAGRVWEIDLSRSRDEELMTCWNLLSMEGRRPDEVQEVVGAVVGAIASAHSWGERATRARTILSNAVRTLAELSYLMVQQGHPELQPTIFQISSLLEDEDWREQVLAHLPPSTAKYWRRSFPNVEPNALNTVTNVLYRMGNSRSLKAFLGSPRSGYDLRRAMATSAVVGVCPGGTGESDELICALLQFDLFREGMARAKIAGQLPVCWAFVDELTAVDGASHGYVAKILEQLRKYNVRFMGMTQMAMRLSDTTRQALLQNQSWLSATGADYDEAAFLAKRMPGLDSQTIQQTPRYHYIQSVDLRGERTTPFRVEGVAVSELFADYYNPDGLDALDAAIDATLSRRPIGEILADLEVLDEQITDHLATRSAPASRRPSGGTGQDVVHRLPQTS
ncbi:ATP/GTP-binding protein [Streptomyces sp. NBC_01381]|uniref:ATP/GTP-binding protein n=1 Tax=Streptomyces sp. NBC_01381 TaxID=2903845 RepID=UPI00225313F1|nr:ATP/GTP-binding protein [Streptomyces sp. NBC_01381]MCX4673654.1 ATP/GTP-binding protein [Streptomyces sp. NBC_01381]